MAVAFHPHVRFGCTGRLRRESVVTANARRRTHSRLMRRHNEDSLNLNRDSGF